MSRRPEDDINLEELSKPELIEQLLLERKSSRKRVRKIKRYNSDTEIALAESIKDRERAYDELAAADLAIINLVDGVLLSKGLPVLQN